MYENMEQCFVCQRIQCYIAIYIVSIIVCNIQVATMICIVYIIVSNIVIVIVVYTC
jgi:hypothetical protein